MINNLANMDPNATIVLLTTAGALQEFFGSFVAQKTERSAESESGVVDRHPDEVTRERARQMLTEKGYRVKSEVWLAKILEDNDVVGKQRGKRLWYSADAIRNIPDLK